MTVADPFDEIMFRALVGRAAVAIDNAAGDEVSSCRLTVAGPAWRVLQYRYAQDARIGELRARATSPALQGLGTLDVRQYYPSIQPARLGQVLREPASLATSRTPWLIS